MINTKLLLLCFLIHPAISLENYLQFVPNSEVTERKSVYELDQIPISVDAFQNNQILIKYIQYIGDLNFPNIKFFCHVKPLDIKFKINRAYLCKRESLSAPEDCHLVAKDTQQIKFGDVMEYEAKYDSTFGITAILNMDINLVKNRMKPFDGFYYCKIVNLLSFLSSNYIEIQDYEFYKKKLSAFITPISTKFQPIPITDVTTNSFPLYLDCGKSVGNYEQNLPKWANTDLLSSFSWSLCLNAKSGIDCFTKVIDPQARKSRSLDDFLAYYQFANGTIVLLGLKISDNTNSGLVCSTRAPPRPYAIYLAQKGVGWRPANFRQLEQYKKKIQTLSQTNVTIVIREGTYRTSRFKLYASYVANPDHTKVSAEWKKNGYSLLPTFESGPYQLTFPTEITESDMGIYILKVSQSEPYDSITFTYSVTVVGVPKLKESGKYSPILYRTVDQLVNISASFERNIIKQSLEINGVVIDFSTAESQEKSLKQLFYDFPFLTEIYVNANFEINEEQGMIQYEAKNLFKNKNAPRPKTHTVTLIAENEIGVSKVSFLVRVFENPVFINYLNDFNCTSKCRNTEEHVFKCSINEQDYLTEGCIVKYLWSLNGLSLNSMNEGYDQKAYLKINNDTIIINPIKSDNSARDDRMNKILTDAVLSCQVVIYEPVKTGQSPSVKLYHSENYPELRSLLEAKINLQVNTVDTASSSWILPFIISLIVLVIIVVLILYFCLRGSGETYNVDQKERAQGHDPEKEIRDNEIFQPYERDHETNVIQPSHISFNDDDSVGVGSDDGELDVYDIDPGKFNEEGSFIGQYASDPRRKKSNGEK